MELTPKQQEGLKKILVVMRNWAKPLKLNLFILIYNIK